VNFRKQATLAGVVVFGAFGDVALSRGMKNLPPIHLNNLPELFSALLTPWVFFGILLLLGFFASYLAALSFADLTYVLPATSVGYIVMALLAIAPSYIQSMLADLLLESDEEQEPVSVPG
jgi:hypothetical protein